MPTDRVPSLRLAAFALPQVGVAAMTYALVAILPAFYAKNTSVSLAAIGGILFLGRMFDVVTDPLVGILSDRTTTSIGRRKPWVIGGTVLAMIAVYYLFMPPQSAGVTYYAVWSMALYLAWTMIDVPYSAWSSELSRGYEERSRISAWIEAAVKIGVLCFIAIPLLPIFESSDMNREVLKVAGWSIIVVLPVFVLVGVIWAPQGLPIPSKKTSLRDIFGSVKSNRPFWFVAASATVGGLAGGMFDSLLYIYVSTHLQMGEKFSLVLIPAILSNLIALPLWLMVIAWLGKHKSWSVSKVLASLILLLMVFIKPEPSGFYFLLALFVLHAGISAGRHVVTRALIADIIDYDVLKTGVNRAGNYYAFSVFMGKTTGAVGAGLSFLLLSFFGYQVGGENTHSAEMGMLVVFLIIPSILSLLSGVIIWFFPIDARRQNIIRRRIETRAERHSRVGSSQ